jgi:putative restriction endonuclease
MSREGLHEGPASGNHSGGKKHPTRGFLALYQVRPYRGDMFAFGGSVPDLPYRLAAFEWLQARSIEYGDVLPWDVLKEGFQHAGEKVHLVGPQGIFKPRQMELPLTLMTAPDGPYEDAWGPDGTIRYKYRGTDPSHPENVALGRLRAAQVPIIYLFGIMKGKYLPAWPVFIEENHPERLEVSISVDDSRQLELLQAGPDAYGATLVGEGADARREYVTAQVKHRVHQRTFRERVLTAYRRQCALCRFRHEELLDAAHITPDADDSGEPVVSNGLALCRLHHGAFDRHFLGIRPDGIVEVRRDLLDEKDGPTLLHGIQRMHRQKISVPRSQAARPDPERLWARFQLFQERQKAS